MNHIRIEAIIALIYDGKTTTQILAKGYSMDEIEHAEDLIEDEEDDDGSLYDDDFDY